MSIQLFVCAPMRFFSNCSVIDPRSFSQELVDTISKETGVRMPVNSWRKGMMEHVWSSAHDRMIRKMQELDLAELRATLQAEMVVPSTTSIKRVMPFSWNWYTGEASDMYIVSTHDFREALEHVEPIMQQCFDTNDHVLDNLRLFRRACSYSARTKFPIFWSI